MRRYETIFISIADLPEEETAGIIDHYRDIVEKQKGTLVKIDRWGRRKLAYEINRHTRGYYVLMDYVGGVEVVNELERNLKIDDKILKFITVRKEDRVDLKAIEKEIVAFKEKEETGERAERTPDERPPEASVTPPEDEPMADKAV